VVIPGDTLEFRLEPPASIAGRVLLEKSDRPVAGLTARVVLAGGLAELRADRPTDESGAFSFENVPPGRHTLCLELPGPRPVFDPLKPQLTVPLDVGQGPWEGTISYPAKPAGEVVFEFARIVSGGVERPVEQSVEVCVLKYLRGGFRVGGRTRHSVWRSHGSFRRHLRAGEYTFRFRIVDGTLNLIEEATVPVVLGETTVRRVVFSGDR
jgi:hypothetical protein